MSNCVEFLAHLYITIIYTDELESTKIKLGRGNDILSDVFVIIHKRNKVQNILKTTTGYFFKNKLWGLLFLLLPLFQLPCRAGRVPPRNVERVTFEETIRFARGIRVKPLGRRIIFSFEYIVKCKHNF